jgi:hypothetical protein
MHEVELSAVTRAGRWRRLELLTNLLDQPETAPMNRQGARGYVEFGGESITTCWTFVDGAAVTLDDVRWWVVRWPEERGRPQTPGAPAPRHRAGFRRRLTGDAGLARDRAINPMKR